MCNFEYKKESSTTKTSQPSPQPTLDTSAILTGSPWRLKSYWRDYNNNLIVDSGEVVPYSGFELFVFNQNGAIFDSFSGTHRYGTWHFLNTKASFCEIWPTDSEVHYFRAMTDSTFSISVDTIRDRQYLVKYP